MRSTWVHMTLLTVFVLGGNVSSNFAQEVPWDIFTDPISGSVCDVVNAGNLELVVLSDTGELVVVTENDYVLADSAFVNEEGVFFFEGFPLGQVAFATDGDGFRTLWLLALDDTVLEVDPVTGEQIFTNLFPDHFVDVPCDAFELWDDDDFDDVSDDFDFCLETPPGAPVEEDGCACFEVDSDGDGLDDCDDECPLDFGDYAFGCPCEEFDDDLDGVDNCFDLCPDTPLNTFVTDDGCPCELFDEHGCVTVIVVEPPPDIVVQPPPVTFACGNFSTLTMALTFGTLVTLRLARWRIREKVTDPDRRNEIA